jgi:hypothetical protein
MNTLRTLLLGETWALPLGVALLAGVSAAADHAGPDWWPSAAGPLLLAAATVLVLAAVWQTSRR